MRPSSSRNPRAGKAAVAKPNQPDRATSLLRAALVIGSLAASFVGGKLVAAQDAAKASPVVVIRRSAPVYNLPPVPTAIVLSPDGYQPPVVVTGGGGGGGGGGGSSRPVARTKSSR